MNYDKKAYAEWEKQVPDATDAEKEVVKTMYATGEKETDAEVVVKQGNDSSPKLDKTK